MGGPTSPPTMTYPRRLLRSLVWRIYYERTYSAQPPRFGCQRPRRLGVRRHSTVGDSSSPLKQEAFSPKECKYWGSSSSSIYPP
jgi:hypothetical protein